MKVQAPHIALIVMTIVAYTNITSAFAMHDSTLGVNTWIASDNSTQLQTTDLNRGPISPVPTTQAETTDDTAVPSTTTPSTPDETEEDADGEGGDEGEDDEEPAEDDDNGEDE
jgi:hypothetical protein